MTDAGKLADELGKAFYLARYEKDGGIWNANDHKILWIRMAEDYERRTAALRTPPTGNAMREALPRPLTQSETASLRQDAISTSMQMKALMKEPQQQREDEDWNIRKFVDFLRADEGDSVTLLCDNPDPRDDTENNAVECHGYWTSWKDKRFSGATLEAALAEAYLECMQWRGALAHGRDDIAKKAALAQPQQQREERTYFIGDEAISLSTAVDAELAKALDASPQEQREDVQPVAWQPIETAPEHERAMFAYRTNLGDWHIELFMGSYFPTQLGYSHWQPLPLPPSQSAPPPLPKRNLND